MSEMGSIVTALGAGSGIDMTGLASDLATAQFALRNDRLTAKSEKLERQISAASSIRNSLSILASSLGDRVRVGDLSPQPQVADSAVATARTPLGLRGSGTYSLEVTQLASGQSLAGPAMASADDPVGAGTLTLRFGTVEGAVFTEDTGRAAVDMEIASGSTLKDVAAAINQSGAGVSAYVATTSSGPRLMLKGEEGAASGFVLEASEAAGEPGLAALAWNPATGDPARLTAIAQDAAFELDGLAMTSPANDTGEVAPGLALTLTGTNAGQPTRIGFADTSANITAAMQDIVSALNEVTGELRTATAPLGGDLANDPGARALRNRFSGLGGEVVMPGAAEGAPRTLSDLGLAIERDGTFRLDTQRLQETLASDPEGVAAMFTTGLNGVYSTFDKLARSASRTGDPGSLAGSIARYQRQSEEVSGDLSELAEKQETLRQTMVARFARADARIAASQSTLDFLKAQIDAWNGGGD